METKNKTHSSELRQDLITGDWVVIATGRAKRPEDFVKNSRIISENNVSECLFCDPEKSGQEKDILIYKDKNGDWTLRVFPNKYPAFIGGKPQSLEEGPYFAMTGAGFHEVIVTRDHHKQAALMETMEIVEVFDAYQERYLDLMNKKDVNYISIFHNHGKEAGASIAHPHSQLMAIPVISPYVELELDGSEKYHRQNRHCVFCVIAEYESKVKKRVVFENEKFIAYCPFASRAAFEVWVVPKKHSPYFERTASEGKISLAEVFGKALHSIYKALGDPAYNFYIHTSPCDGKDYPHFHWHLEILPHTAVWAGFELQTGIEISTIPPEAAAEFLRSRQNL
ncbi:MAG: galactose-1-phosphate uridylyltransferase [Candidatus Moranbacteria bacterium RIFCSPHIGHO2_02_FULL_40_12b]|nr:MAG: galactose-1-phosphate uridylyltransferase [Candidatus Moranbacteria bacterium RIFCSPHIGHO2_02_FULL_40_12b]